MAASHPSDVRAAVLAALLSGQRVSEVAASFKLPLPTVKSWWQRWGRKNRVPHQAEDVHPDASGASTATEKRQELGDLVMAYLRANLETLAAQQKVFRDPEWIRKQPAESIAVLHGVCLDKAIRLLEALEASGLEAQGSSGA